MNNSWGLNVRGDEERNARTLSLLHVLCARYLARSQPVAF